MSAKDTEKIGCWEAHLGSHLKVIASGERMTLIQSVIRSGSKIPPQSHPHEQITFCLQGEAIFRIGRETFQIKKGYSLIIPPNIMHSGMAIGNQEYLSVEAFSTPRQDLLRGEFKPTGSR
ncbi:AraC family ligand binding domain-containing protein [Candidatus Bathyarchaeota archaeon]|nr:AraC family ligand binding domain-containing protein [Candidatus Bathyarchaeota archaeon]